MEEFRDIPGYPGLKASSFGRIIGLKGEEVGCHKFKYVLCGGRTDTGRGKWIQSRARLILRAFVGAPPPGMTADHINRNKHDDRPENLRWATNGDQNHNRPVMGHSSTKIKGLYRLKANEPNHSDRWRCTITVNKINHVQHFKIDKRQDAIDWLTAKRIELGI